MPKNPAHTRVVLGQKSWSLKSRRISASVTVEGGHLGPARFRIAGRSVEPLSVAPWAEETLPAATPPILRVLRGDFFCLPFGGGDRPFRGERHPVHGETANSRWNLESLSARELRASLDTKVRRGRVEKLVRLGADDACIYQRHVVSGMKGPMNLGQHLMLRFRSPARISTSRFVYGQVLPTPFERPAAGGYQALRAGARFSSLSRVPAADGSSADLTRYPARAGFEDLVMIVADPKARFAWTAASFPEEGFVCFSLKDPRVLRQTVFWSSNGGRHYPPWNGRHVGVLGMEEVTSYFNSGLPGSVAPNPISRLGYPTSLNLSASRPLAVNVILGVAPVSRRFGRVVAIAAQPGGQAIRIRGENGQSVLAPVDLGFLAGVS